MTFPLMVRAIRLALDSVDRGLEAAARTLGPARSTGSYHHPALDVARILAGPSRLLPRGWDSSAR